MLESVDLPIYNERWIEYNQFLINVIILDNVKKEFFFNNCEFSWEIFVFKLYCEDCWVELGMHILKLLKLLLLLLLWIILFKDGVF